MSQRPTMLRGPLLWIASRTWLFWVAVAGAGSVMLLVAGAICVQRVFKFPDDFVSVTAKAAWPTPLKELLDDPDGIEIDESAIQVGEIQGWEWTWTYIWRMDATPGLFEYVTDKWDLAQVKAPPEMMATGKERLFGDAKLPHWWPPQNDGNTLYYVAGPAYTTAACAQELYVAINEPQRKIWVHWWLDF